MEPITFPLPSTCRFLDINQRNQMVLLHDDRETISLYTADPVSGFKEAWTRPTPQPDTRSWDTIHITEEGGILLHNIQQETVVMDCEGSEVSRWPARCLYLLAASSSRIVYRAENYGNYQLHVHDARDHLNRVFSLSPQDKWADPDVNIGPDGRFYVADLHKRVLAAFSATGKRMYERELTYKPGPVAIQGQSIYTQTQDNLTMLYIHESGSGQQKKKMFPAEGLGLIGEDLIRRVWTGEGGKLHIAVYNDTQERIITHTNLTPTK